MKLSEYLRSNAVSRREFAAKVGITEAALCRYISGVRMPRPQIVRAIMSASGGTVTPNDFIEANPEPETPAAAE